MFAGVCERCNMGDCRMSKEDDGKRGDLSIALNMLVTASNDRNR